MIKKFMSVEVNTETSEILREGKVIDLPYDIHCAYMALATFEYLKDNYSNDDEVLWRIAIDVREVQNECECNGHPITEGEAIEMICNLLNITLEEE